MAALLWKMSSVFNTPELRNNPLGGLVPHLWLAQSAGLYFGLVGGILVAGAIGYPFSVSPAGTRALDHQSNRVHCWWAASCSIHRRGGYVLQDGLTIGAPAGDPSRPAQPFQVPAFVTPEDPRVAWRRKYNVDEGQFEGMIANYRARKYPEQVSGSDWWEETPHLEHQSKSMTSTHRSNHENGMWRSGAEASRHRATLIATSISEVVKRRTN
ncbi:MAG: hypothetical protein R3C20_24950 [Planctomycetaceae bacterium]